MICWYHRKVRLPSYLSNKYFQVLIPKGYHFGTEGFWVLFLLTFDCILYPAYASWSGRGFAQATKVSISLISVSSIPFLAFIPSRLLLAFPWMCDRANKWPYEGQLIMSTQGLPRAGSCHAGARLFLVSQPWVVRVCPFLAIHPQWGHGEHPSGRSAWVRTEQLKRQLSLWQPFTIRRWTDHVLCWDAHQQGPKLSVRRSCQRRERSRGFEV